jgi:hypothetical protein
MSSGCHIQQGRCEHLSSQKVLWTVALDVPRGSVLPTRSSARLGAPSSPHCWHSDPPSLGSFGSGV